MAFIFFTTLLNRGMNRQMKASKTSSGFRRIIPPFSNARQFAITSQIFNAKADYVLVLKANHPTLHKQVKDWFDQHLREGFLGITHSYDERVEKVTLAISR